MPAVTHRTFLDLYTDVMSRMKLPLTDTRALDACKGFINSRYNTIAMTKNWPWRKKERDIKVPAKKTTGTLAVTNGSRIITATGASFSTEHVGWHIRVASDEEIYKIVSITVSGATQTLYLSADYVGTTDTDATYTSFLFQIGLPPDCDEVDEIWNFKLRRTLDKASPRDFFEIVAGNPHATGTPEFYTTYGFAAYRSPTLGNFLLMYDFLNDNTSEDDLKISVFPIVPDEDCILRLIYLPFVAPLNEDTDEPLIPRDKRHILVYGAYADMLARERLTEDAAVWKEEFEKMLAKMAGDDEATDKRPVFTVPGVYWTRRRPAMPELGDMGSAFDRYRNPYF